MADGLLCRAEKKTLAGLSDSANKTLTSSPPPPTTFYADDIATENFDVCQKSQEAVTTTATTPTPEDCRKKRCVDRYDSSESSDSGVAVLSCTDCSGSSTASSDITDPGSPFSTASSHSEDSGGGGGSRQSAVQTAHHPPWPWSTAPQAQQDEGQPPPKKATTNQSHDTKTAATQCLTTNHALGAAPPPLIAKLPAPKATKLVNINNNCSTSNMNQVRLAPPTSAPPTTPTLQQGKITEYFKSQIKSTSIGLRNLVKVAGSTNKKLLNGKTVRKETAKRSPMEAKNRVPRKILPAPSKNLFNNQQHHFAPATVTLTAVGFPPNLTYLHTKAPKPPDNIFMPQHLYNHVIHQVPNNFNCVKVVPVVKLATTRLPQLSVETALPTVLSAKPKLPEVIQVSQVCVVPVATQPATPIIAATSPATPESVDSGISCEVALPALVEEQKSPILSQPKTIRFPAAKKPQEKEVCKEATQSLDGLCRWAGCQARFDTSGALLEHLQVKHVISQATQEQYVCLWLGCKVHGRKSCSRSWLERHVLAHAGTKPFRCIVDGCGQRFNSQLMLERHVNGHFNSDGSQTSSAKKSLDNGQVKQFKRNGKRIRFRRQPWSARMFDFIDSGIMEGLQHKLLMMTQKRTLGRMMGSAGDSVKLTSQVVARRTEPDGSTKFLVRWHPADVVPEEWVAEGDYRSTQTVSIPQLSNSGKNALKPTLFPKTPEESRTKHRRKPPKTVAPIKQT